MENKEVFTHCNKCPNKVTSKIGKDNKSNWYCGKVPDVYTVTKNKNISYYVNDGELVPAPNWCPLKVKSDNKYSALSSSYKEEDYKPKTVVSPWSNLPHTSSWDDIKVNEIYHVPPINGEKRMDIIITSKTDYYIGYKTITKDGAAIVSYNSFYKTSLQVNFLVKHKLIEFKTKNG